MHASVLGINGMKNGQVKEVCCSKKDQGDD